MTRVLVIKLSSFGDLFHALPVVHILKRELGVAVDWVTHRAYADVVGCFDDVDKVIGFPRESFPLKFPGFYSELREHSYDLVIDLQGLFKSAALVGAMTKAPRRVGPSFSREGARLFYHQVPKKNPDGRHAVEQTLDVFECLGIDASPPYAFPVTFPKKVLEGEGKKVALVPCSRWPAKNWAPEHFVEVGRRLREERGATLYVCGGPPDRTACEEIAQALGEGVVNTCGTTTLVELGSTLQEMDLVLSVDSGPMHLAAALDVPVLAIFGATDPRRTGPYGEKHRVLIAPEFKDNPELARSFKKDHLAGAWHVPVGEVVDSALEMLGP